MTTVVVDLDGIAPGFSTQTQPPDSTLASPGSPNSQVGESIQTTVKNILKLGIPLNVGQVAQLSIIVVMMSFIGRFGTHALGGASLAMGIMNATGYSFGGGLAGALETLLSHSYGHNPKSKLYGTHTQRMIILQLLVSIPLGFLVAHIGTILTWLGQPAEVVQYTELFTRVSLWGLVPYMLLEVNRRYFAAQHLSTALTVAIVVAALLNPLLQWSLTFSNFGFQGAPAAWCLLLVLMNVGLVVYLVVSGRARDTWGGWSPDALRHWRPMLVLAVPSLGMTLAEWAALEVNTVLAGFAPPVDLAAFAITVQTAITMWTMPSGVYMAMSVLIGNKIGERRPLLARQYALCGVATVFVISLFNVLTVIALGEAIPKFFSSDERVIAKFMSIRWFVLLFHFADAFQSNMLGILRGIGMQNRGVLGVGLSFGVVGSPLGLLLFLSGAVDVAAMWIGPAVGVYCVGVPLYVWTMRHVDWALLQPHVESLPAEIEEEEREMDVTAL